MDPTVLTVCYLIKNNEVLLGLKKIRLGKGLYNGYGGHKETDETVVACAKREFEAETNMTITSELKKVGILLITYENNDMVAKIHFFCIPDATGSPRETDEMIPRWFTIDNIPYNNMWPNDQYCLPIVLKGKYFAGHFHLDNPETKILLKHWVDEVDSVPNTINPNRL